MPFNGTGTFQRIRNWVADAAAGIKIRADYHDSEDDGFAAGLSNCITKDGQTTITQNIPFNSKRITGLADPVNPQDAATKASVAALTTDKVAKTGDTMTGNLVINVDNGGLILQSALGAAPVITGRKAALDRWTMYLGDGAAESGANVGSDFYLARFNDAGARIDYPLTFNRATGLGVVMGDPTAPLGIVTKQYADARDALKVNKAGDTLTGNLHTASSAIIQTAGPAGALQVNSTGAHAAMTFLNQSFGANFGLSTDGNLYLGGWSHGATLYKIWTTRDFSAVPVSNGRLAMARDVPFMELGTAETYEPHPGAVITGWAFGMAGGSTQVVTSFRLRWMQLFTTSWFTVGTA